MYKLFLLSFASLLGSAVSHVEMVEPAPRNSKNLKGVRSGLIDYGMNSPLGEGRPYPCIGYEKGPASKSYSPGDSIETELSGSATHNGGHCQFSLSYDGKTFVALKTVLGDCLIASKSYSIPIPKDAPSGDAVYAWSWINRTGNREFYMNCADIKILGNNKGGSVKGHEIVVAHVGAGGKKTSEFPEGFSNDFGKQIFESTPMVSISPSGSNQESAGYDTKPTDSYETKPEVNGAKPDHSYETKPEVDGNKSEQTYETNPEVNGTKPEQSYGKRPGVDSAKPKQTYETNPEVNGAKPEQSYGAKPEVDGAKPEKSYGTKPEVDGAKPEQAYGTKPEVDGAKPEQSYETKPEVNGAKPEQSYGTGTPSIINDPTPADSNSAYDDGFYHPGYQTKSSAGKAYDDGFYKSN